MTNQMGTSAYSIEEYNNKIKAIKTLEKIVVSLRIKGYWCVDTKKQVDENRDAFNYSKSIGVSSGDFSDDDQSSISEDVIMKVAEKWITLGNGSKVRFPDFPSKKNEHQPARIYITFED